MGHPHRSLLHCADGPPDGRRTGRLRVRIASDRPLGRSVHDHPEWRCAARDRERWAM